MTPDYVFAVCLHCHDAVRPIAEVPRGCRCGRLDAWFEAGEPDPTVEADAGAALVQFPGNALDTAIQDAQETVATTKRCGGGVGITRAHVWLVGEKEGP